VTTSPAGKIVLITGASSGIGEATARHLAEAGHHVVLGARRVERLAALVEELKTAGHSAEYAELDVTSFDDVRGFVDAALERHGQVDVLVNNAGVMPLSPLAALRVEEWKPDDRRQPARVLHGIAAVLPSMQQRHAGHIVNVASTAAHRVDPTAAVYCATKYACAPCPKATPGEHRGPRHRHQPRIHPVRAGQPGRGREVQAGARTATQQIGIPASGSPTPSATPSANPTTSTSARSSSPHRTELGPHRD